MRFNLNLEEKRNEQFRRLIPRGIRSEFCRIIIGLALDKVEEYGPGFVGLTMAKDIVFSPSTSLSQILEHSDDEPRTTQHDPGYKSSPD
jgi:hypothetical protein